MSQVIYGKNSVQEALKAKRRRILEIYISDKSDTPDLFKSAGVQVKKLSKEKLDQLVEGAPHQGMAARVEGFAYSSIEEVTRGEKSFLLICDSLQDPQNLGAIARSAYAFGVDAIVLAKDRSVEVTPAVSKASAGAIEHLPVVRVTNLSRTMDDLKKEGFWFYAADAGADETLEKMKPSPKMGVVLGSEGEGIRPLVLKNCDFHFKIPFARPFDSLNVAQAASVIVYEISKKRSIPGSQIDKILNKNI